MATIETLAGRLSGVAEETGYAAVRLDRLHAGTWLGAAAEKFGEKAGQLPPKLHAATDAFRSAESAYRSYAADLSHGQTEALRAMSMWSSALSATATWRAQVDALPANDPGKSAPDPGAWLRNEAQTVYGAAVEMVDKSARRAADTLDHAADLAPHGPGFWSQAWHAVTSFGDGMWDGTVGMVKMAWEFSPLRMEIDPLGWARDTQALGKSLYWGATHPVDFGKAIADNFMKDPAHALGELVPGLLVAAATGGTGLAATAVREGAERVASVTVTTAEKLAAATRSALEPRTVVHAHIEPPTVVGPIDLAHLGSMTPHELAAIDVESVVQHIEAKTGMPFRRTPNGGYESPSGLLYERDLNTGEHRIVHALRHGAPALHKPVHTVFKDQMGLLVDVDRAWAFRGLSDHGNPMRFTVPLGAVGTLGETSIVIILRNVLTSELRTTFLEP